MDDLRLKVENILAKGENFKNPSAAEASESVYMRVRVKLLRAISLVLPLNM